MNAKKFSDAMSELDTKYVDEALNYKKKAGKKNPNPSLSRKGLGLPCLVRVVMQNFLKTIVV